MTDPYEYLLSKLNVILQFMPEFNTRSLYIKLEIDKKLIANYIPLDWTHKQIFKFYRNLSFNEYYGQYNKEIDRFSKFFRNIDFNEYYIQFNKELGVFCQLLRQFPDELESIEHVDMLLTVNGLNKEA